VKATGLYEVKPWFVRRLTWIDDGPGPVAIHPNTLTAGGVVASAGVGAALALGGVLHAPLLWLIPAPLVLARLTLNALDGAVARRTGAARPFGTVLNEAGDRAETPWLSGRRVRRSGRAGIRSRGRRLPV